MSKYGTVRCSGPLALERRSERTIFLTLQIPVHAAEKLRDPWVRAVCLSFHRTIL